MDDIAMDDIAFLSAAPARWCCVVASMLHLQWRCAVCLQVCSFSYGDISVRVREGALGDGLGAKVWSVCHIMVR